MERSSTTGQFEPDAQWGPEHRAEILRRHESGESLRAIARDFEGRRSRYSLSKDLEAAYAEMPKQRRPASKKSGRLNPRLIIEEIATQTKDPRARLDAAKTLQKIAEAGTWDIALPNDEYAFVYLTGDEAEEFRDRRPGSKVEVLSSEDPHYLEGSTLVRPADGSEGLIHVMPLRDDLDLLP